MATKTKNGKNHSTDWTKAKWVHENVEAGYSAEVKDVSSIQNFRNYLRAIAGRPGVYIVRPAADGAVTAYRLQK